MHLFSNDTYSRSTASDFSATDCCSGWVCRQSFCAKPTRRHFSADRIVLEGLRGEDSIAELCRREGIVQNLYYRWSKDFLEAGKKRLAGATARAATSDEVKDLRREASALKEVVAELTLENRLLKKSVTADGEDAA